jgi:hypothetical protein
MQHPPASQSVAQLPPYRLDTPPPARAACCPQQTQPGFGRIGRLVLRATLGRKDVNVVAINGACVL